MNYDTKVYEEIITAIGEEAPSSGDHATASETESNYKFNVEGIDSIHEATPGYHSNSTDKSSDGGVQLSALPPLPIPSPPATHVAGAVRLKDNTNRGSGKSTANGSTPRSTTQHHQ